MKKQIMVGLLAVGVAAALWMMWRPARPAQAIELTAPTTSVFLEDEAGISAYFSTTVSINVNSNLLRNQFRTIEVISGTYLIGSVPAPGYGQSEDVKAFVHNSGWVIAYYPNTSPVSRIFDMESSASNTVTTRLEKVLANLAGALGASNYTVYYYDWRYPQANRLLLIGEARGSSGSDSYSFSLPGTFSYYERSWYFKSNSLGGSFILDGATLGSTSSSGQFTYGFIPDAQLVTDATHAVSIYNSVTYWGDVFGGLAIVYQEP